MDAFADVFRFLRCPLKRTKKKCPEILGHALTIFQVKFQNFHSTVSCGTLWSLKGRILKCQPPKKLDGGFFLVFSLIKSRWTENS